MTGCTKKRVPKMGGAPFMSVSDAYKEKYVWRRYRNSAFVRNATYSRARRSFVSCSVPVEKQRQYHCHKQGGRLRKYRGIVGTLDEHYFAGLKRPRHTQSRAAQKSSRQKGTAVHEDMTRVVDSGGAYEPELESSRMLKAWLEKRGHDFVGSELPVYIKWDDNKFDVHIECMTQVDLVTRCRKTRLYWAWEIKTGLLSPKRNGYIPCFKALPQSQLSKWHLQVFFGAYGLCCGGIPIKRTGVLRVFYSKRRKQWEVRHYQTPECLRVK